jgi:hypothetical protein
VSRKWHKHIEVVCERHGVESRWYNSKLHPFCFNVKMRWPLNFDKAMENAAKEYHGGFAALVLDIDDIPTMRREFENSNTVYECIIEDMQRNFDVKDSDHMRYLRPQIQNRYRIDPQMAGFDVEYEFVGRSSGWVSIAHFEGWQLARQETREFWIDEFKENPQYARKLCAMIEEVGLVVAQREQEFHYQAGFQLGLLVERLGD